MIQKTQILERRCPVCQEVREEDMAEVQEVQEDTGAMEARRGDAAGVAESQCRRREDTAEDAAEDAAAYRFAV